jgi:UDP-glucose 4-epimerase
MRAAVIGAAGFIGSHLCRYLSERGVEVLAIDRNALPESLPVRGALRAELAEPAVSDAIAQERLDHVFLLAGSSAVGPSIEDPLGDLAANAAGTLAFLEAMRHRRVDSMLVYASSAAVYGNPAQLPVSVSSPTAPISPYGISKLAAEQYVRAYGPLHRLRTVVARPFSVYGPGLRRQVVWDILNKLHGLRPAMLFGNGNETRDFVYISDACSALVRIAESGTPGSTYNICSGQETPIALLAAKLSQLTATSPVEFAGVSRPGDPLRWRGDFAELAALEWRPAVDLDEGLAQTAAWYRAVTEEAMVSPGVPFGGSGFSAE